MEDLRGMSIMQDKCIDFDLNSFSDVPEKKNYSLAVAYMAMFAMLSFMLTRANCFASLFFLSFFTAIMMTTMMITMAMRTISMAKLAPIQRMSPTLLVLPWSISFLMWL